MNHSELVEKVADAGGVAKLEAERMVTAVLGAVSDALKAGEKVSLSGFGIFDITDRKAREGRNPATGETIQIAASKTIKFRPTKSLKDAVSPPAKATPKAKPKASAKKPATKK